MIDSATRTVPGTRTRRRRTLVAALWAVALTAVVVRVGLSLSDAVLPGEPWQTATGDLRDFRDVVWVPGRYVLDGGNPYDPATYLVDHPWAPQFSAYPPVWLVLGVLFGPLPYLLSAALFQVLAAAVAVVLLRVTARWLLPTVADLAVPAGLLWLNVWYPGRGALASLGSVLAVLGVVLVLRGICRRPDPAAGRAPFDLGCAVGVACTLVKPQFGVLLLVAAVVGGRWRETWRGVLGFGVACLPLFAVVAVAAGGPWGFVQSIARNQQYVWGPDTPGGLGSPFQRRFDVFGALADAGFVPQPGWFTLAVTLFAVALTVFAVRRTRDPFLLTAVVCGAVLLCFFHPWYDGVILIVPVAAGLGLLLAGGLTTPLSRLAFGGYAVAVLHLHTVTMRIVPGLDVATADTVDFLFTLAGFALACAALLVDGRRRPVTAAADQGSAAP